MTSIGQKEILPYNQVIRFFKVQRGYEYLGSWKDRQVRRCDWHWCNG